MPEDPHPPAGAAQAWATSAVSIVNGFFGDYLTERQNGLAIDMAFYHNHRPLPLTSRQPAARAWAADQQGVRVGPWPGRPRRCLDFS